MNGDIQMMANFDVNTDGTVSGTNFYIVLAS